MGDNYELGPKEWFDFYWKHVCPDKPKPNVCQTCNMVFDGPTGYVCPRSDCPTYPRVIS